MTEILFCHSKEYLQNQLFNKNNLILNRDGTLVPIIELKKSIEKKGYDVKTIDESKNLEKSDKIVFFNIPSRSDKYYGNCLSKGLIEKMIVLLFEPPAVLPRNYEVKKHENFSKIMTWNDDLVDNKKYKKIFFPNPFHFGDKIIIERGTFENKKLLCLINSNKYFDHPHQLYTERAKMIRFMQRKYPNDFDLFGIDWDLPVFHNPWLHKAKINALLRKGLNITGIRSKKISGYSSYRGKIMSKNEIFKKYRFSICYENQFRLNGYITEKIIDTMVNSNVPVYLGADNITEYIPKKCFVDRRDFEDNDALYEYLKSVEKKEHVEYLCGIEEYLNSKKFYPFTIEGFIETMEKTLEV